MIRSILKEFHLFPALLPSHELFKLTRHRQTNLRGKANTFRAVGSLHFRGAQIANEP